MTGRKWGAVALYALAVAVLLWSALEIRQGGTVAPLFLIVPILGIVAGRLWKTGEEGK